MVVGHALHQIAIVRHHHERARPRVQQVLQNGEHVGVQVIAGLVEDEHVGFLQQDEQQLQTALLPAGEVADARVQVL